MLRLCTSILLLFCINISFAYSQTVPTAYETQVGEACKKGAFSADFDTLTHCTSNDSAAGVFQKAPVIIGQLTSPPYTNTNCNSAKEGMLRYDSGTFYVCDGSSWTSIFSGSGGAMVGAIKMWAMNTAPTGYLECNGAAISRTTYSSLFAIIGTTYGVGDGSTTFNLPNYNGEFLRGLDNGSGNDLEAASRTDRGDGTTGDVVGSKQLSANISHLHTVNPPSTTTNSAGGHSHSYTRMDRSGAFSATGSGSASRDDYTTGYSSYAGAHNHTLNIAAFNSVSSGASDGRPRNVSIMYIIKY